MKVRVETSIVILEGGVINEKISADDFNSVCINWM